jgi:prepilin-type N-terminal cleavage/methylation domain-containing protein
MRRKLGFSLIEVLVALAIVAILAAVLTPVFIAVKDESKRIVCISNFRQVGASNALYQIDYDDKFVIAKYRGPNAENPYVDKTWVQLVQPYLRSVNTTYCPADYTHVHQEGVFDPDLTQGVNAERLYFESQRANTGYNYIYLSPLVMEGDGQWTAKPRNIAEFQDPSKTLVLADSVWSVDGGGRPLGGGNYLVIPPCRYTSPDSGDSFGLTAYRNERIYTASRIWDDGRPPRRIRFGGLWEWHRGRLTTLMADGSIKASTINKLSEGCQVRPNWGGLIFDPSRYNWGMR